ncbi:MAG: N-acetylmuramoyl-L-alanine amidase, partial [Candidatus Nanopelagicales bacterium]
AAPDPQQHTHEAPAGSVRALGAGTPVRPAAAAAIAIAKPAELIAVTADEPFPDGAAIAIRVRDSAGWSQWTELAAEPEHGPDPGSAEAREARVGTDPLMAQGATSAQVRIDTPSGTLPAGTELTLVDAPTAPADDSMGKVSALGTIGKPSIVTRAQWGANESWRGRAPYYTNSIRAGFIHHTASTSNYSKSQAAAQLRSIYAYHTKSLNHSDIDYNFVVDRFGRLYEGRAGGIDRPVLGGHTAGFNEHTFGAVVLGNFSTFSPSGSDMAAIKDSLARLFAWKLGLYGVSPDATVKLTSAGFVRPTKYPKGAVATISATSSHQTVNYTSCPGTAIQAQLASIRALGGRYSNVAISAPTPADSSLVSGSTSAVTFTTSTNRALTWTADLLSPCSDTPVRRITGKSSKAGPISIRWDLRDSAGTAVRPANYTLRVSGSAADGTPVQTVSTSLRITPAPGQAWGPCANASRVVGANLSATSVLWGQIVAPGSRTVVLAGTGTSAAATAAGLSAAPLARSLTAPLLLTSAGSLSAEVRADLGARRASQVLVVGGTDVVSEATLRSVTALGASVTRLAGSTPAATSAAVAARMGAGTPAVLVSPTGSPATAVAGAAMAAARGIPLLVADSTSIPSPTRAALAGRPAVTVASSTMLSDATVRAALGSVPWTRTTGADAVSASVAVAGATPGSPRSVMVLPENPTSWGSAPIAAAAGVPLLITASPTLSPQVATFLAGRAALGATTTPVSAGWLDDEVLGATSRILLGQPWAPPGVPSGTAPPAPKPTPPAAVPAPTPTKKYRVSRTNASPEPIGKGRTLRVQVTSVQAKYTDGKYRKVPAGVAFTVQFKATGKTYKTVASGRTITGKARTYLTATQSGRWRILVGATKTTSDYVRVMK